MNGRDIDLKQAARVLIILCFGTLLPLSATPTLAGPLHTPQKSLTVDPNLILKPRAPGFSDGPLSKRALERAYSPEVKVQLEHFLTDKREDIRRAISLSTRYLDEILPILERHGLPRELAYLCIIESGYRYQARSYAGAVGMWQMIRATSSRFGLRTNTWEDERLDFSRSTDGAARFFRYLLALFEDWDHVLAAYNAGEGRVRHAIARARKRGLEPVMENLQLPRETKIYVPAFYAALLIAMEPERYGIFPDYHPPIDYLEVSVPGGVKLDAVANKLETDTEVLRTLNPSIRRDRIPPTGKTFTLRVPCYLDQEFVRTAAVGFSEVKWIEYRVKKGDTLWDISRRFGVTTGMIDRVRSRRGRRTSLIYPGEILLIPISAVNDIPGRFG
ncbi:MAG: transglycosylase SLT domain-containing protein [bacterium]|nr:MAG: transglycosylase SLT domain-containing protein [bacterium]